MANPALGLHQFQQLPLAAAAALQNDGGSLVMAARSASGALSAASTDTGPHAGDYLMGSRACSLCSNLGDDVGTEEEAEEELSRQLTREILLEFEALSTQDGGGGGAGGDPQPPRSHRASHRSSLRSSRMASGAELEDAAGEEAVAGEDGKEAGVEEDEEEQLPSLYDQVGGGVAVKALVDEFYRRVLDDPRLAIFFEGVDMSKHARKFLLFVTYVLGGPDEYLQLNPEPWPQLYAVHERLITNSGLVEAHFDMVQQHFRAALEKLGVGQVEIGQALAIVETTRRVIFPLTKPALPKEQQAAPRCPFTGKSATPAAGGVKAQSAVDP